MNTPTHYEPTDPPPGYNAPTRGAGGAGGPGGPLDEQHYEQLRSAKSRRVKIDRAVAVATFNGWSAGVFAALSALFLLLSFDPAGLLISLGLGLVAYYEFKGRRLLRALDERGPRVLGFNQIGFGLLIVAYCAWSLFTELTGPGAYAQTIEQNPELAQILGSTDGLLRFAVVLVYGTAIALTVPYQALMAWYYFSRGKHMKTYLSQTPGWVTDLERAAA